MNKPMSENRLAAITVHLRRGTFLDDDKGPWIQSVVGDLLAELDRLRAIADALLCKTTDGVYYARYDPQEVNPPLWVVCLYGELEPWRVSKARVPTTPDEVSTDFDLLIEDAEDQCVVFGIYSTPEAAEAAREKT